MSRLSDWIDAFDGVKLAVFGDVMLDRYTFGDSDRISPEAPTIVFRSQRVEQMIGGAGNVARNLVSLGGQAALVGVTGTDDAGQALANAASETDRLTATFATTDQVRTTVKNRFVAKNQQVLRVDEEDRLALPDSLIDNMLDRLEQALDGAQALVLSDYAKGVLTPDSIARAIALADKAGIPVIADPKSKDLARYAGARVITPNTKEAEDATGLDCRTDAGAAEAAEQIAAMVGCPMVLLTRGSQGMTLRQSDGQIRHLPTMAQEVFDVSGAGDTVVAALAIALAAGVPVEIAAELANRAAGIVVGKVGTATVSAAELHVATHGGGPDGRKIVDLRGACTAAEAWRAQGQRIVFTNGCFDLLHPGHISLLDFARSQGDRLIVALNTDASVRRLKGPSRPIQDQESRAAVMQALRDVDLVVLFDEDTPLDTIRAIRPDVLVKGADYAVADVVGAQDVLDKGGQVLLAPLVDGHSTSVAIARATPKTDA